TYGEGQITIEDAKAQMEEIKRLAALKREKEESEKRLKVLTPEELEAQAAELAAYEAKRAKMLKEYNNCINFRFDPLPITKISYRVNNSTKEACMRITRNNQPLNLTMYDKFVLKMLGFSEWLEVHDLASKVKSKSNYLLLKNPKAKFQWKIRRSSEIIKEVFVKEDIMVDGMHRNLVPPPGVVGSKGLVIKEPESGIFFYNGKFDLVFQREEEFHLATTAQLIRIQSTIKRDTPEGKEMYKKMEFVIEARNDVVEARKIVKDNLDNLGQQM
ncbi:hypothetical protein Tco_1279587, partial [Tanacetum coccineum]